MPANPYNPPFLLFNGHLQTIYPSLFRKVNTGLYKAERISTPDDDFLDLDWATVGSKKLAILSHGLEGNSRRTYMVGMAQALNGAGWDVLAWNFRGCSGSINRKLRMYHSGTTDDLHTVIQYAGLRGYDELAVIGFSMGGSQILKYLAEYRAVILSSIKKALVFSVPCDLLSSSQKLARWSNKMYMRRFLKLLKVKIAAKARQYPSKVDISGYDALKTFMEFDDRYTAPIHGFKDAKDYYNLCSSRQFIPQIKIPTLIINALNDPFLTPECFPYEEAESNTSVQLETPRQGGHTGFALFNEKDIYWSEQRALEFLNS